MPIPQACGKTELAEYEIYIYRSNEITELMFSWIFGNSFIWIAQ